MTIRQIHQTLVMAHQGGRSNSIHAAAFRYRMQMIIRVSRPASGRWLQPASLAVINLHVHGARRRKPRGDACGTVIEIIDDHDQRRRSLPSGRSAHRRGSAASTAVNDLAAPAAARITGELIKNHHHARPSREWSLAAHPAT